MTRRESLMGVHTHTHTHTYNLEKKRGGIICHF